ncbi:flagellar biosynthetic protein FliO [Clostridium sp. D53t1_180928_C8]|uniref:flagellar biosynthetic protein FliO n=1 Tax=Clostridium sp. D53t1_180928_C8 TaxID=2787101 RepID=UPI0018A8A6AB|nr:flagellar biosynthetic protein FliO [Clostridium sp. D53t1_180928_C8]
MDKTFLEFIINLIVLIPIILLLIVISLRLSKKSLDKLTLGSYVKVIERFNLTKDINLYVIKMGTTGCVLVSSNNNIQVIKELNENEVEEIINMKNNKSNSIALKGINELWVSNILNNNFTRKKDNGYTKSDFK